MTKIGNLLVVCMGLLFNASANATVTFYDTQSDFLANSSATLRATFESSAGGVYFEGGYFEGGVNVHPGPTNGQTTLYPRPGAYPENSQALTSHGNEDFILTFGNAPTHAIGFTSFTNPYAPPVVTVYGAANDIIGSLTLTQLPSTEGCVGIISDQEIGQVRWLATDGQVADTLIDDVYVDNAVAAVPEPETYTMLFLGLGLIGVAYRRGSHSN